MRKAPAGKNEKSLSSLMLTRDVLQYTLRFLPISALMRMRCVARMFRDLVTREFERRGRTVDEHLMFMKFVLDILPDTVVDVGTECSTCCIYNSYIILWHDSSKTVCDPAGFITSVFGPELFHARMTNFTYMRDDVSAWITYNGVVYNAEAEISIDGVPYIFHEHGYIFAPVGAKKIKLHNTEYGFTQQAITHNGREVWATTPDYYNRTHMRHEFGYEHTFREDGTKIRYPHGPIGLYDDIVVSYKGECVRGGKTFIDGRDDCRVDFIRGLCVRLERSQLRIWRSATMPKHPLHGTGRV